MTDADLNNEDLFDEDEAPKRKAPRRRHGDRILALGGFALATAAAFFPWYVFFNQDNFGIAPMAGYGDSRDLPDTQGRSMVNVSPLAIPKGPSSSDEATPFDPIVTATVPTDSDSIDSSTSGALFDPNQTFPGKPSYRLLHVVNGRALIEDKSGMYVVRVGSTLPDNSKLARLEERDGKWVIVTSDGAVITR